MSSAMRAAALINSQQNCIRLRAAFFHSTPVLDRRRRTHWDSRSSHYSRRSRKLQSKQTLLRNDWQSDHDQNDPSSSNGTSWFRRQHWGKGSKRSQTGKQGPRCKSRRGFEFCEDDVGIETIFRSAFGGNGYFYWSFVNEENPQWRSSSGYSNNYRTSWNWRDRIDEEYDSSTESDSSELDMASDRMALGLSASGPLKLDEVKKAYRACALKWHPDRHHGSSKAVAEEKFKLCSAAYQSLCDKLALD
ncbi:uncharacterized protein LOC131168545 isoform X2 [Malania oleifera]|uniref:uncharacterized protein LOC131168545 isoform X2 n=1 Tax=Malania oleifera TaxID=397392 RepID=UPI0025ADF0E8|nr:uncharacterized protein LOC131168545 isoform X2 [Malania oleifera]